jgi:Zn-dependent protease with chaperone function
MEYDPKLPEENVNVSSTSPLVEFVSLTAGLLILVVLVYWLLGLGVDWAVDRMTPEQEKALALNIDFEGIEGMGQPHQPEAQILQRIVDRLQSQCTHLPYDLRVLYIPEPDVNAVALPGGTILVFRGLLDTLKSENALVFVLGHELGHFHNRDHLKHLGRSLVLMALWSLVTGGGDSVGGLLTPSLNVANARHSQGQETRADEFGLQALHCLYGHVSGATRFFEIMQENEDPGPLNRFFATHPGSPDRIRHLQEMAETNGFREGRVVPLPEELRSAPAG